MRQSFFFSAFSAHSAVSSSFLVNEEEQAIDSFQSMTAKISAIKRNRITLAEEDADDFIRGLRKLKERDPEAFERIQSKLSKELEILGRLTT